MMIGFYPKTKKGTIIGIKIAFVSGIVSPLLIELIAGIHEFVSGRPIKIFILVMPILYIVIAILHFCILVVPCVLGGCFRSFTASENSNF